MSQVISRSVCYSALSIYCTSSPRSRRLMLIMILSYVALTHAVAWQQNPDRCRMCASLPSINVHGNLHSLSTHSFWTELREGESCRSCLWAGIDPPDPVVFCSHGRFPCTQCPYAPSKEPFVMSCSSDGRASRDTVQQPCPHPLLLANPTIQVSSCKIQSRQRPEPDISIIVVSLFPKEE
jgi:hypothetical protein